MSIREQRLGPLTPAGREGAPTFWQVVAETVTACYPLAIALMVVKYDLLFHQWGIRIIAGQQAGSNPTDLPGLIPQLRFFAADALEAFGVVPLVLLILFGWVRTRRRVLATTSVIAGLTALSVAAWLVLLAVGRFPTLELARDYLESLRSDPGLVSASDYLPDPAERQAALLVLAGFLPGVLLWRRRFERGAGAHLVSVLGGLGAMILVVAAGLWAGTAQRSVYHRGILWRVGTEFVPSSRKDLATLPHRTLDDLRRSWLALSLADTSRGAPVPATDAACSSAVVVILETASARDYSFEELHAGMPRTRRWLDHALIARRHLATHPWSNRADFSMFSGLYDLSGRLNSENFLQRASAPGKPSSIPWILREQGYETRYYYPGTFTFAADRWAVSYLGFEHVYSGSGYVASLSPSARLAPEQRMFARAEQDLRAGVDSRRPFFLVLRTMLGHDPLFSPQQLTKVSPTDRAGRRAAIQGVLGAIDSLLAPVLAEASRRQAPERIAVVIVGDHGVRDRQDPDLQGERFHPLSYHVPAVVSCPSRFPKSVQLEQATSHIDIAPTLAWLLGVPAGAWLHSGLEMLDPRLSRRYTFMLGESFNGLDAVMQGDTILVANRVDGTTQRMLFEDAESSSTRLLAPTESHNAGRQRLDAIGELQAATLRYLMMDRLGVKPNGGE